MKRWKPRTCSAARPRRANTPPTWWRAADSTDTNLGTLAGTLVTQRTLELLPLQFPVLGRITTDFSDLPAQFNQTIVSRIISIPSAQDYDTSTGWTDSTAATSDVPIT